MSDRFYLGLILALGVFAMLFLFAPQLRLLGRQRKRKKFEAWYEAGPKLEPNLANNLAISCNFCGGRSVKKTLVGSYPRKDLLRKVEHQEVDEARFFEYRCAKCGSLIYKERQCLLAPKPVDSRINEASDFEQAKSWFMSGLRAMEEQSYEKAEIAFQKSLALVSDRSSTWTNFAAARLKLKKFEGALQAATRAVEIDPTNHEGWLNRGLASAALGLNNEAESFYQKAIDIEPRNLEVFINLGNLKKEAGYVAEALANYEKAKTINPDFEYLHGELLHTKMHACNWSDFEISLRTIETNVHRGLKSVKPFVALSLKDDPDLQLQAAMGYSQDKFSEIKSLGKFAKPKSGDKICIGCYSPDLNSHPVAFLCAGMFKTLDCHKFELIAFSFKNKPIDPMQQRLQNEFDRLIDVSAMSDLEVARLSREMGINIAVDLAGHTSGARQQIFAYRAAPLQLNYLGYPGASGMAEMDYIIADSVVIPPQFRQAYSENVIYLPHCFQVNDNLRAFPSQKISRKSLGLPEDGVVFCCLNNTYKINPTMFASWMRILQRTQGAVLWLIAEAEMAVHNLKAYALELGIDPSRIVVSKRLPLEKFQSSLACADLFLDTLPFNAGTTASDALWAGLPLLTCQGKSFAARMASSILRAADLGELVTTSLEEYEALAIELANNPERLDALRQRLAAGRKTAPLFNTQQTTRHMEQAFELIHQRWLRGEPAQDIRIAA